MKDQEKYEDKKKRYREDQMRKKAEDDRQHELQAPLICKYHFSQSYHQNKATNNNVHDRLHKSKKLVIADKLDTHNKSSQPSSQLVSFYFYLFIYAFISFITILFIYFLFLK
jgi:hypothetical protein